MKQIDQVTAFLFMMESLTPMRNNAKASDFRRFRDEIHDLTNQAKIAKFELKPIEAIFMAKILQVIPTVFVTPFRYIMQTTGATFRDLLEFLAHNEELLIDGVTIKPPVLTNPNAKRYKRESIKEPTQSQSQRTG